jgi:hypothetical protein
VAFSDWSGRLTTVGATSTELASISAGYYSSATNVQQALDTLIGSIANVDLLEMLTNWRTHAGPFQASYPGGGLLFTTLSGSPGPQGPPGLSATLRGAWVTGTTYTAGPPPDAVLGSDGAWYYSLVSGNVGHNPVGDGGVHWASGLPSSVESASRARVYLETYAICDGVLHGDGAVASGSVVFTSASANFTAADAGKAISIAPVLNSATVGQTTTIATYVNATTVHLAAPSPAPLTAADFIYGTIQTAQAQAAINAALAAHVALDVSMPDGWCLLDAPLNAPSALSVVGGGVSDVGGSVGSSANPPWAADLPPYLTGSVFVQMTAGANGINAPVVSQAYSPQRFGIMFAPAIRHLNTGHGHYCVPPTVSGFPDLGILNARWDDLVVWGTDGNHYGYVIQNPVLGQIGAIRGYGGGVLKLIASAYGGAAASVGNLNLVQVYGAIWCDGTAHGVELVSDNSQLILCKWDRPQTIFLTMPPNLGNQVPAGTQHCLADTGSQSSRYQLWLAPDWEAEEAGGPAVYPTDPTGAIVISSGFTGNSALPQLAVQQLLGLAGADITANSKGVIDSTVYPVGWQARTNDPAWIAWQFAAIAGQTADLTQWLDAYAVERTAFLQNGAFISDAPAVGPVLKDAINGHYYRLQIQNGAVTPVDLGTARPTGQFAKPSDVDGLSIWVEARLIGSPPASGTAIAAWADSSVKGNNFAQATGGDQPLYETGGPNGQPFVRFNGSTDYLEIASLIGFVASPGMTVFVVYRRNAATANAGLFSLGSGSGSDYADANSITVNQGAGGTSHEIEWNGAPSFVADAGAGWQVGESYFAMQSNPIYAEVNGGAATQNTPTYETSITPTLGVLGARYLSGAVAGPFGQVDIAALLVFNKQLTTAERSVIRQFLGTTYGITVAP